MPLKRLLRLFPFVHLLPALPLSAENQPSNSVIARHQLDYAPAAASPALNAMPCFRAWADAFRLSSQKSETDGCRSATTGVGAWRFKTQASRLDLISRIRVQFGLMASGLAMSRFSRGSSLLLPSLLPGKNDEAMEQKPLNDIRHHLHHLNSTQLNSTQPSVEPVWGGEWMLQGCHTQCHLVHSEHPSIQLSLRDMICTTRYAHR
ncbi:hypothetical protein HZ326_17567 [Fusarium oxysporum f. sp. albedinis]|nr:hypothetical protein HZ326_17567 [Fusarium oxysporum f. sp. albedinis]